MPPVVSAVEGGFTLVSRKKRKRSIRVVSVYVTAGHSLRAKKVHTHGFISIRPHFWEQGANWKWCISTKRGACYLIHMQTPHFWQAWEPFLDRLWWWMLYTYELFTVQWLVWNRMTIFKLHNCWKIAELCCYRWMMRNFWSSGQYFENENFACILLFTHTMMLEFCDNYYLVYK